MQDSVSLITRLFRLIEFTRPGVTTVMHHRMAVVLIVLSSVGLSFGGLILRNIEQATPWQINFYRSLAQIIVLIGMLAAQHKSRSVTQLTGIGRPGLLAGAFISLAPIGYVLALIHTTVANTLFIISAIPFITAALAWLFLGERVRTGTWIAMSIAATGILIMVVEGFGIGSLFGNVMALGTATVFSCFAVIVRHHRGVNMMPTLIISGVITGLICYFVSLTDLTVPPQDMLLCLLWGVLAGFGNWMFIAAARHLAAAEVTLFMMVEFVLGPIWVWLFVNEIPSLFTLIGGAIVLTAVSGRAAIDIRARQTRNATEEAPGIMG